MDCNFKSSARKGRISPLDLRKNSLKVAENEYLNSKIRFAVCRASCTLVKLSSTESVSDRDALQSRWSILLHSRSANETGPHNDTDSNRSRHLEQSARILKLSRIEPRGGLGGSGDQRARLRQTPTYRTSVTICSLIAAVIDQKIIFHRVCRRLHAQ